MSSPITDVRVVALESMNRPVYKATSGASRGYVQFGERNDYPEFLLDLYNNGTTHGAIINGKAKYIFGKGVKETSNAKLNKFIAKANSNESLNDVMRKCIIDLEIFGGFYLQVIWSRIGGYIAEVHHIDYTTIRTNKNNTQFWYKECWNGDYSRGGKPVPIPAFNPDNPYGLQMLYVKQYRAGLRGYALPDYSPGITMVQAEIEIEGGILQNAQTGFNASIHVTFMDDPSDEQKRATEKRFLKKFTGVKGQKVLIAWAGADPNRAPKIEPIGESDLTKQDFTPVSDLVTTKIFVAHSVVSGVLFGVATPGSLGENNKLEEAYNIFKTTYADPKQQFVCDVFNKLASYRGIAEADIQLQDVPPTDIQLDSGTVAGVMTPQEIRERAGLDPIQSTPVQQPGAGQPAQEELEASSETKVNDVLTNLTGKQNINLERIMRKHSNGSITTEHAKLLLTSGYGLTDAQAATLLGLQEFSNKDPYQLLGSFGATRESFTIIRSRNVTFESDEDMVFDEENKGPISIQFAQKELSEIEKQVLDLITKDPLITNEVIAESLSISADKVERAVSSLSSRSIIEVLDEERKPTAKAQTIDTEPGIDMRIMYSYEGPKDAKNRPFCAEMLKLNRLYTRKDIESLSSLMGYSVFDRRGGWYTIPGTDEHRPFCRHSWKSNVVLAKN